MVTIRKMINEQRMDNDRTMRDNWNKAYDLATSKADWINKASALAAIMWDVDHNWNKANNRLSFKKDVEANILTVGDFVWDKFLIAFPKTRQ